MRDVRRNKIVGPKTGFPVLIIWKYVQIIVVEIFNDNRFKRIKKKIEKSKITKIIIIFSYFNLSYCNLRIVYIV